MRRHERFFGLTGLQPGMRVLDVGCGALGLRALEPGLDITGVDVDPRPGYPGPFVQADATERLPFEDDAFDLVYSSSVVEHIAPERRERFAAELRRVGRGLVRADAGVVLPDRAARPAALRALAPRRAAPRRTGASAPRPGRSCTCSAGARCSGSSAPPAPSAWGHLSRAGSSWSP